MPVAPASSSSRFGSNTTASLTWAKKKGSWAEEPVREIGVVVSSTFAMAASRLSWYAPVAPSTRSVPARRFQ